MSGQQLRLFTGEDDQSSEDIAAMQQRLNITQALERGVITAENIPPEVFNRQLETAADITNLINFYRRIDVKGQEHAARLREKKAQKPRTFEREEPHEWS